MTDDIIRNLIYRLRINSSSYIIMPNVYVKGSPWESDVIRVSPHGYWTEYEIKVSRADYQADFRKRVCGYRKNSALKHDVYKSLSPEYPKPKNFYFVTPKGLLDGYTIPPHCGLMEFEPSDKIVWPMKIVKKSPQLKNSTKLDSSAMFALALKSSSRFVGMAYNLWDRK